MRADIELLRGAIDIHLHSGPSVFERHDVLDMIRGYRDAGVRGVILKSHHLVTTDRADMCMRLVPGIDVFGSIVLNYAVGGINPYAVDAAFRRGARKVWMPTIDSHRQCEHFGQIGGYGNTASHSVAAPSFYQESDPIYILTSEGSLTPQAMQVLEVIRDHDGILGMGHLHFEEMQALVEAGRSMGITKIVVDHPQMPFTGLSLEQQKELAGAGAKMNYVFASVSPKWHFVEVATLVEQIRAVGFENAIISTDLGQIVNPMPADGLRIFIRILIEEGVREEDIRTMLHVNPAALLYGER